ncbi:unnamed protein product [Notodromas monacha]|uniref:Cuticle protein n=1 Tax=Notodromas monacha TaxID=399045 RepID=A0A7R9BVI4_9CRUS|nr:unnamed protein product [Notodromas monacha]CAG0922153.1 unnamed protein product [Notodromas monacha]
MNSLILLPLCFAACMASVFPVGLHKQYVHHEHLVAPVVHKTAHVARSQYHSQDNFGQYSYGYAEPNGAKKETRHADGTVVGSYSHPLPDGSFLTNNYVADEYGFRSSLAPTAHKDFAPVVKAAYDVTAPIVAHSVGAYAVPRPDIHLTKRVDAFVPAAAYAYPTYAQPAAYGYGVPALAPMLSHDPTSTSRSASTPSSRLLLMLTRLTLSLLPMATVHPLPDGSILTNNYVADEYGFRSSLAPTAHKDFAPVVKAAYDVTAPIVAHSVGAYAVPRPDIHLTKRVDAFVPAAAYAYPTYAQPAVYGYGVPALAPYNAYRKYY